MPEPRSLLLVLGNSTGGIGVHVSTVAAACAARGYDVTVCGPAATEDTFHFSATGAAFVPLPVGLRLLAKPSARRRLRDLLGESAVVHAHGLQAGVVVCRVAPRAQRKVVVSWHNAPLSSGPRRWLHVLLERLTVRRAAVVVGVSEDLVVRARRAGAADARFVPVAPAPLSAAGRGPAAIRESLVIGDSPVVLGIGRLHRQKRFVDLVWAAELWRQRAPVPVVLIAGSGPERAALARLIKGLGIDVRLLGRRDDIADLMSVADVVVLPSSWEARPLVAQEALAAGRALVATPVGGVPSLVGSAAILVPVGKPQSIASAVVRLLDDPDSRHDLERQAVVRAATWPDAAAVADLLMVLYAGLATS